MRPGFWRRRLIVPVLDLLRQGVTPEKISLSIVLGAALGVFPVLGSTTLLCAAAALLFRLNLPAIQLVNYLIYPLQLVLLVPFMRMGARLFGAAGEELTVAAVVETVRQGFLHAMASLGTATAHAIVAWTLAVPVPLMVLYFVLSAVLRRAGARFGGWSTTEQPKES